MEEQSNKKPRMETSEMNYLESFFRHNPLGSFFKGTFDADDIVCLKLTCKLFKGYLDEMYPPYRSEEKGSMWIVRYALKKGNWKVAWYLFETVDRHIPTSEEAYFTKENLFDYPIFDRSQIPIWKTLASYIGPINYSLDQVLQAGNFVLFELLWYEGQNGENEIEWTTDDNLLCTKIAVKSCLAALKYLWHSGLLLQVSTHTTSMLLQEASQESLEWLLKQGFQFHIDSDLIEWNIFDWKNAKFIIDNIQAMDVNREFLLLLAATNINDLEYVGKKHPDQYDASLSVRSIMVKVIQQTRNPEFFRSHQDLVVQHWNRGYLSNADEREALWPCVPEILNIMIARNMSIEEFPISILFTSDFDYVKMIYEKSVSKDFAMPCDLYEITDFEKLEWVVAQQEFDFKLSTLITEEICKNPIVLDPRFQRWIRSFSFDEQFTYFDVDLSEFEKAKFLLREFPRHAEIDEEQLLKIRSPETVMGLEAMFRIDRRDKKSILHRFDSEQMTDFMLQNLVDSGDLDPEHDKISIDQALIDRKYWLLRYVRDEKKPFRKILEIVDPQKVIQKAKKDHRFGIAKEMKKMYS